MFKNLFVCVDASSTKRGQACLKIIFSTLTQGLHVNPQQKSLLDSCVAHGNTFRKHGPIVFTVSVTASCSHSTPQRGITHWALWNSNFRVFLFYMTHYCVFYISTMSLDGRVAAGCFFLLHDTGESTNIFLLLLFWGRKIDCDFEGRKIDSTNLKILVGRCRDRPSSALLLICPKEKPLNQRRKRKRKNASNKKKRES